MENIIAFAATCAENFAALFNGFFCLLPIALLIAYIIAVGLTVESEKFRYADKSTLFPLTAFSACFHFAVGAVAFTSTAEYFISLVVFALCFAVLTLLFAISDLKIRLSKREKRLMSALSAERDDLLSPKRKIEFLSGERETDLSIEPNFNEIKKITSALKNKQLTPQEEDEIDKTEMDMERFSTRKIQPFERKIFSERLLKIVKMTSKYDLDVSGL